MTSRESILAAVRASKPDDRPLPELPVYAAERTRDLALFSASLAGSKATVINKVDLKTHLRAVYPDAKTIVSTLPEVPGTLDPAAVEDPLQLAGVDLTVLLARLGVAENGALWVAETEMIVRALPFITQHLVLVLDGPIVPTMHEAYRLVKIDETGFGCFIAGPSKTADIEQSLVIGAHGPRSLVVAV